MVDIFNFIAQVALVFFVLWLIDRILLALLGATWRREE